MKKSTRIQKNATDVRHSLQPSDGQTLIEYALMIAVVVLILILAFPSLSRSTINVFTRYEDTLDQASALWTSSNIVFQDDFQSLDNWTTTRGEFDIDEQGRLYNSNSGENRSFMNYQGSDFQMSIDVAHLTEGQGYGVWFRASDMDSPSGINGYTFQYDPGYGNGAFVFRKWENGHEKSPFGRVDASDFEWYDEHEITLQVNGNTFTAFVNGEPVATAQDDTYTTGVVGLRTWGNSKAYFDDITIEEG
ncbi:MAG: DUF1080 domain-containing protein [Caldisericia bacterium]|nr:DUF1080 domain-containing protein [Caldisericia bacterium]MDD4614435.1 DUF1080 domain-containing protein [Caldisericia bacterium]